MPTHNRARAKGRAERSQSFAGIPRRVMRHPDFQRLSPRAVALLLWLAHDYRGKNNGDLSAVWSTMRARGWRSKTTVREAVKELLEAGMIVRTRDPIWLNPGSQCALYALTWAPIDETEVELDMQPTALPVRTFHPEERFENVSLPLRKVQAQQQNHGDRFCHRVGPDSVTGRPKNGHDPPSMGPDSGPMEHFHGDRF